VALAARKRWTTSFPSHGPRDAFDPPPWPWFANCRKPFHPGIALVLVADRGFPSAALFGQLLAEQMGWTVRLRPSDWIENAGLYAMVASHLEAGRASEGDHRARNCAEAHAHQRKVGMSSTTF
jgi:hypothetical protein